MPRKPEHISKAEGNERFARSLDNKDPASVDWAIVALFYTALHYIEAYFAQVGTHHRDHQTRDDSIYKDPKTKPIYRTYSKLKSYGHNARYYVYAFDETDIKYAESHLATIKAHLSGLI